MTFLRRRGVLALLVVLGNAAGMVLASRVWLTGGTDDPVLGARTIEVTGASASRAVVALALVSMAGTLARLTSGPRLRVVALVTTIAANVGAVVTISRLMLDPESVLGPQAAAAAGRQGSIEVAAALTPWIYLAVGTAVIGMLAAIGLAFAPRRSPQQGLSARYDPPGAPARSDWDQLTDGVDPTEDR